MLSEALVDVDSLALKDALVEADSLALSDALVEADSLALKDALEQFGKKTNAFSKVTIQFDFNPASGF